MKILRQPHNRPTTITVPGDGSGSWWCRPELQTSRDAFLVARDLELARMRTSKFARPNYHTVLSLDTEL